MSGRPPGQESGRPVERAAAPGRFGDLGLRVLSSAGLAAVVAFDLWLGGLWVAALAALAAVLMLWELHRMATGDDRAGAPALVLAAAAAAAAVFAAGAAGPGWAVLLVGLGAAGVALVRPAGGWMAAGLVYIGLAMAYVTLLRDDPALGLGAILWLVVVVATADIGAYFAGRALGGPRLWPAVSPNKTWSGALGGLLAGGGAALGVGAGLGWSAASGAALGAGVVVASQAGDLLESSVKRHFGVKDASRIIPGHGGVMDRLDGVVGGLWFFALCDMVAASLGASLGTVLGG